METSVPMTHWGRGGQGLQDRDWADHDWADLDREDPDLQDPDLQDLDRGDLDRGAPGLQGRDRVRRDRADRADRAGRGWILMVWVGRRGHLNTKIRVNHRLHVEVRDVMANLVAAGVILPELKIYRLRFRFCAS
jgi:hypothetical protein